MMAVGDAHVFPGFLTPVLTQLSFQSHQLLILHASADLRGENMPEKTVHLKVPITRKVFVYKIQENPIHTILKYGNYYDFMDW